MDIILIQSLTYFPRFTGDTCILSVKTAQIYNVTLKHTELVYVQQPIFN